MIGNFQPSLTAVWVFDGLKADAAPGEKFTTAWGVTEMTYHSARMEGVDVPDDINDATREDCAAVLKWYAWDKCECDLLPLGIDLMMFNDAMLTGSPHASMLLQRMVGVDDDGIVGPHTLSAVNSQNSSVLLNRLEAADVQYLSRLRNAPMFLRGWTRREVYMRNLGQRWIAAGKATN